MSRKNIFMKAPFPDREYNLLRVNTRYVQIWIWYTYVVPTKHPQGNVVLYSINILEAGNFHIEFLLLFAYDSSTIISNISTRCSSNSESNASELLEHIEEMLPL